MKRWMMFAYGLGTYVMFLGVFLYAIGFIGGFGVPTTLDAPARGPVGKALLINVGLLAVFALQHSGMARRGFKEWITRYIPKEMERSTYVLVTNLLMVGLFAFWQPLGGTIWNVQQPVARVAIQAVYGGGWLLVLVATFLINHFDLFGLRQSWAALQGTSPSPLRFATPWLYRVVRHPLYVGWITVFWAAPTMTAAHLFFAIMTTAYILVAIQLEERDLIREHGHAYREYRQRVPMLVPGRRVAPDFQTERAAA